MATQGTSKNGIIFMVSEDGKVSVGDYLLSTSYEMAIKIQPLIEKVAPKVREYFEEVLKREMEKRTEVC